MDSLDNISKLQSDMGQRELDEIWFNAMERQFEEFEVLDQIVSSWKQFEETTHETIKKGHVGNVNLDIQSHIIEIGRIRSKFKSEIALRCYEKEFKSHLDELEKLEKLLTLKRDEIINSNPCYLVDKEKLKEIHDSYNSNVFEPVSFDCFCEVFNSNSKQQTHLEIKKPGRFYYLLHRLWDYGDEKAKEKWNNNKKDFAKDIIGNSGGSLGTFNKGLASEGSCRDEKYKKEVEQILK